MIGGGGGSDIRYGPVALEAESLFLLMCRLPVHRVFLGSTVWVRREEFSEVEIISRGNIDGVEGELLFIYSVLLTSYLSTLCIT